MIFDATARAPWRLTALAVGWAALSFACSNGSSAPAPAASQTAGSAGNGSSAGTATGGGGAGGQPPTQGGALAQTGGSASGQSGRGGEQTDAGAGGVAGGQSDPLVIYWIDVEGGAATILIAPDGQVVVVDAGFPGARDAGRIARVLQDEMHADHIDHLICTHYHNDHVGGIPTLAAMLPVSHFYDHGPTVQQSGDFDAYLKAAGDKRIITKPGDKLDLGGARLTFVTAAGEVIDPPLATALPNPTCPSTVTKTNDGGAENAQSLGFVADYGKFTFIDLADVVWSVEQKLMCPTNRVGTVDIYQVNHHGMDISNSPQLVHALAPTVAVMNNGASKGGSPAAFEIIQASPGLAALWALHSVTGNDAEHNAEEALTANLAGTDSAHWLKAVVAADGSYTVSNGRNGTSRSYQAR